ncbi:MAG: site-2 protease family protein [Treponema sp.]|nr:site-2 protease family protein [Treponema sp.]
MLNLQNMLYSLPGILLGLTVHEFCHALCAWRLGDDTAREEGRLTLNPLRHIDPVGFLFLLVVGFGWAKPVRFNPARLRNYRRDRALIALAGPFSNLALGIVLALALRAALSAAAPSIAFLNGLYVAALINFALFIFNMLPIPPLDGSHVVFSLFNAKPKTEILLAKIGMPALIALLLIQNFASISILPIGAAARALVDFFL